MRNFFLRHIMPILNEVIAIELSDSNIIIYNKADGGADPIVDPTAEVIVELSLETIRLAKNLKTKKRLLRRKSAKFFDEALAIRKIEELKPNFSVEYYSCNYSPPN